MKIKYPVVFVEDKSIKNYENSIVVSSILTEDSLNHYLRTGNVVVNLSENCFNFRTGLAEGLKISSPVDLESYNLMQDLPAWMKVAVVDELVDLDLALLKGIDWVILKSQSDNIGNYISQAWKYGFKLWAEKYPLSQQEMPEKVLIYLNSR